MRYIKKQGDGGYHLDQANLPPPVTALGATSRWGSFGYKQNVLNYLLSDQYFLCCYSEIRADQFNLGYHIEHVENKSQNPQRTFDYSNLAASALESDKIRPFLQANSAASGNNYIFGGHAQGKQTAVDMSRFVSPLVPGCERFFSYLSDGRVVPSNQLQTQDSDKAQYTIDLLNLNSPFLIVKRRKWREELDELFVEHQATEKDLHSLASIDLVPTNQGLSSFFSLTRQFFGSIAEAVLQSDAPELV